MLDWHYVVLNLHRREALAAEVEASTPDRRSWIAVRAFKDSWSGLKLSEAPWVYTAKWIEIDKRHLEERIYGLDGDEDFIIVRGEVRVSTPEKLRESLSPWMNGQVILNYSYLCDYPI